MGKFKKGKSGNPAGRPKGIVDRRRKYSELLKPHAHELVDKAVELALSGDVNALRLCIERLIPRAKDESINLKISNEQLTNAESLLDCNSDLIRAIANGELTAEEVRPIVTMITNQLRLVEITKIEKQVNEMYRSFKENELLNKRY
jgi:hypothetical protein